MGKEGAFLHASEPHSLPGVRRKHKEPGPEPINILHDPRVVHGNTYSLRRALPTVPVPGSALPVPPAGPSTRRSSKPHKRRLEHGESASWSVSMSSKPE
jgi:hypothetical protein